MALPPMEPIPENPTRDDGLKGLALLKGLLTEFPFVGGVAKSVSLSVALSGILTTVTRAYFPVAPLHGANAHVAGTGKSYLFDTISSIAFGDLAPVMPPPNDDTAVEMDKQLVAAVITGQPMIVIDNINGELASSLLCQLVERPRGKVRILGKSEEARIVTRGTTFFADGNNMTLRGDIVRRTIVSDLDAGMERPELREFKNTPVKMVLNDRGNYIAAALTMCRSYIAAGMPNQAPPLASFEGWNMVRSALMWLGEVDPVKSIEASRVDDPDRDALREILSTWVEAVGDAKIKIRDLIALAYATESSPMGGTPKLKWPKLNAALRAVGERRGELDAKTLGNWARRGKGVICGDYRLVCDPDESHGSKWWVQDLDEKRKEDQRGEEM
jgi:putative DNA primase/helicase